MGNSDDPPLSRHPTASGALTRLAYDHANAAGIDLKGILRKASLTRLEIEDPGARLRVRNQIIFLNLVAEALKDDLLGFHLAHLPDLREIGWLYYVLASSGTMNEALQRAARYSSMTNEGVSLRGIDSAELIVGIDYVGVSRHIDRHQIEFIATILVRMCRQLADLRTMPASARFVHHRKSIPSAFTEFMGGNVEFGAAADEVAFPGPVKELPVVSADPYLNRLLVTHCEEALAHRGTYRGSFRFSVENTLVPLLPHGKPRAAEIARRIGTSQRTFARRLAMEGLTFSEVLESLRLDLAKRHLADTDLSISDIAWLLGYQEVSAFTHAFKRWTGKTPREVRYRSAWP